MSNNENIKKFVKEVTNETYNKINEDLISPIEQTVGELELRTHIGKELDYGSFSMTSNSNTEFIYFNKKNSGNLEVDSDGNIILNPNRKYNIAFAVRTDGKLVLQYKLYNKSSNSVIGNSNITTQVDQSGVNPAIDIIETGNEKVKLCLKRIYNSGSGNIYSSNSFLTIQEINRQVILDTAEEAKNLEFDRGYFITSYVNGTQFIGNSIIKYDKKINGNLEIDSNGGIVLKAGKKYEISFGFQAHTITDGNTSFSLFDLNTNEFLPNSSIYLFTATANYAYNTASSRTLTIETDRDISLSLKEEKGRSYCLVENGCFINITEKTNPYYFNYYKDSISSKVLFEGECNVKGDYTLNDDITNYEWIVIKWECSLTANNIRNLYEDTININNLEIGNVLNRYILCRNFSIPASTSKYSNEIFLYFKDNKTLNIIDILSDGAYSIGNGITKIIGYGFNYENPYRDLISGTSFSYTEEDINEIYNELGGN